MEPSVGRDDYKTAVTLPLFQKIFSIKHTPPYTVTRVPTQIGAVLPLTTFSPAEIVGARFWAKKKRKGLSTTTAPFQKADTTAGLRSRKRDRSSFRVGRESRHFRRGNRRVVQDALKESDKSSRRLSENRLNSL
jgi:hypothetical protein